MRVTGKRLKIVWVSDMFVSELITGIITGVKCTGIPKDARVHNIYYDYARACFGIVLEHESFDELAEAQIIPDLAVTVEKIFNKKPMCQRISNYFN